MGNAEIREMRRQIGYMYGRERGGLRRVEIGNSGRTCGLSDTSMRDKSRLDLRGRQAVAGDVDDV